MEIGGILFQLPTRGLSVYTFQVPTQFQNCKVFIAMFYLSLASTAQNMIPM